MSRRSVATPLWLASLLTAVALASAGCGGVGVLPSGQKVTQSAWESFDAAKGAFDRIVPYRTTLGQLQELGFDPYATPNIRILNHIDVAQRFGFDHAHQEAFPRGLRECLAVGRGCQALDVVVDNRRDERIGGFFADFFNFQRRSWETGWTFHALILLRGETVVYKLWGGRPQVDELIVQRNPLGPLQGLGHLGGTVVERQIE